MLSARLRGLQLATLAMSVCLFIFACKSSGPSLPLENHSVLFENPSFSLNLRGESGMAISAGPDVSESILKKAIASREIVFQKLLETYEPVFLSHQKTLSFIIVKSRAALFRSSRINVTTENAFVEIAVPMISDPSLSDDGFATLLCHEIGHALGGFPLHPLSNEKVFASSEGQSDYYASQRCLKALWKDDVEANRRSRDVAKKVFPAAIDRCADAWEVERDADLCVRSIVSSHNAMSFVAESLFELKDVNFDEPSHREVKLSLAVMPDLQCRFDTLVAGALCSREVDPRVLTPQKRESDAISCRQGREIYGFRPRCWYREG